MARKLPWFKWFPGDWRKDNGLQSCSLEARGLWIELLNIMAESERPGYLIINGKPPSIEQISRLVGEPRFKCVSSALQELENAEVFSKEGEIIFSRRMVQDAQNRVDSYSRVLKHRIINTERNDDETEMKRSCNGKVTGRSQKLDINNKASASPPDSNPSKEKKSREPEPIPSPPEPYRTHRCLEAWEAFKAYRAEKRNRVTPRSAKMLFAKAVAVQVTPEAFAQRLEDSIANGWAGVFFETSFQNSRTSAPAEDQPSGKILAAKTMARGQFVSIYGESPDKYLGGQ